MIKLLEFSQACEWFSRLPSERQIATLSPHYLVADAARDTSSEPFFLSYSEGDVFWLHGTLRGRVAGTDGWDFQSPYGYGGPVTNGNAEFCTRASNAYGQWCREHGIIAEFVRLHPLAAWQHYGGTIRQDRMTVAVPLEVGDIRAGYETRCRTAVRKAEAAGLNVVEKPKAEIRTHFPEFYRNGMAQIGADDFYVFNDAYFAAIERMPQVHLLVCESKGQWLSAGVFLEGGTTLEYHLSATAPEGRRQSATNLLLDGAAQWGKTRGLKTLYLGGGTDGAADNPLYFFKSGFSATRLPFAYGFIVHRPDIYQQIKEHFTREGKPTSRVLFYR